MRPSTIFEFGDAKLLANDLDPLYAALVRAGLTQDELEQFTVAEVTFDLAGKAARVVERAKEIGFWVAMFEAGADTKRGAPRRYYRGMQCNASLSCLRQQYRSAGEMLRDLAGPYHDALWRVEKKWPGFGPTAAFKMCDMAERVCGVPVDFSRVGEADICSNVQVRKGWDKAARVLGISPRELLKRLVDYPWAKRAPPRRDRPLNVQEFETLLCYYSHEDHLNNHLPGMDHIGIAKELTGHGELAQRVIDSLPKDSPG